MNMKKCKMCGNREIEIDIDYREKSKTPTLYFAVCSSITCGLRTQNFETKQEAVENWNKWNAHRPIVRAKKQY